MPGSRPLRLAPEWDDRFGRMLGVSALGHALALGAVILLAGSGGDRLPPLVAYTVELTDPSALGGRLPAGPSARDLSVGPPRLPAPEPKGESVEPAAPVAEAKPEPKPEPKVEPKPEPKPEAKPEPKPAPEATVRLPDKTKPLEPKPEEKKPEPPKPPVAKPEPAKPEPPKPEAAKPAPKKPEPPAEPRPEAKPAEAASAAKQGKPGSPTGTEEAPPRDAYAAAADRWRTRAGGGVGGTDQGSGPIGTGGPGKGGGGELAALEFIAYRQQVINTIKASWTNVITRPGLVAAVRFEIAADGEVTNARLARSSGNPAYDASALRAVQRTPRLPAPPSRYVSEFRDFTIEFHSEESGGQGEG